MIHKILFYIISWTWGLPMTLVGVVGTLGLIITKHKPRRWGYCWCFEIGRGWGGLSLGPVIITSQTATDCAKIHEHGHSIQNCLFGPFMLLVVSIPSVIRYWCRKWAVNNGLVDLNDLPDYDSVWYEKQATKFGTEFIDWHENNTK